MRLPMDVPQHFFDDAHIAYQHRLVRRWLPAEVQPRPVIEPDRPWEGRILSLHGTVLPEPDGTGWRMYYGDFAGHEAPSKILMARSDDALTWTKPELGAVEHNGSKANNIVLAPASGQDSPSVVYDADDPEHPWKLLTFQHVGEGTWAPQWGLHAYHSRDGVAWRRVPDGWLRAGDRTNLMAEKVGGRFVAYTRHKDMVEHIGGRAVYRTESEDFAHWSEPKLVMAPDLDDEPNAQIYGMSVFRRNGWYLGLVEYWHDTPDVIETYLAFSRDGWNWTRPVPRRPLIAARFDWNRAWSSCTSNGPVIRRDEMVFHVGGRWVAHSYGGGRQYAAIGLAAIGLDRFCALEAITGGRLDTAPLCWPGGELTLNADTRQDFTSHPAHCNGRITVEVLDAEGRPMAGYSGDAAADFCGNTHCRSRLHPATVCWPGEKRLAELAGQTIRLRFSMEHARLFTFAAAGQEQDGSE